MNWRPRWMTAVRRSQALQRAQTAYQQAREQAEQLEEDYRRKNRAFLDEQAGVLAQSLEDGSPCPVCGSLHHPAPAQLSGGAPTEAELEQVKGKLEAAPAAGPDKEPGCGGGAGRPGGAAAPASDTDVGVYSGP